MRVLKSRGLLFGGLWEEVLKPRGVRFGHPLGPLEGRLGPSWAPLGASWRPLGAEGSDFRLVVTLLGHSWGRLWRSLGLRGRFSGRLGLEGPS